MADCADFSRTCAGCPHAAEEERAKGKTLYRCLAPGPCRGYTVGVGRFNPYVPAWCPGPGMQKEETT